MFQRVYLNINLTKHVKDLYAKTAKCFRNQINENLNK